MLELKRNVRMFHPETFERISIKFGIDSLCIHLLGEFSCFFVPLFY
jgi:hypothetical protein